MSPAGDHPYTVQQTALAAGHNGINSGAECAGVAIIRGKHLSGVVRAFWPSLGFRNVATGTSTDYSKSTNDLVAEDSTTNVMPM